MEYYSFFLYGKKKVANLIRLLINYALCTILNGYFFFEYYELVFNVEFKNFIFHTFPKNVLFC